MPTAATRRREAAMAAFAKRLAGAMSTVRYYDRFLDDPALENG
jgi:hypothetical protein